MPSWKHRRRLIYATYFLSVVMIIYAAINYAVDGEVARELIIGAVAMISIIITAYTAFATLDDKWHFKDEDEK
jgi:cadmium resistance protein CadD (predicted permease)